MDSPHVSPRGLVAAAVAIAIGFCTTAWASEQNAATVINTKNMCPVCAKKIVEKLRQLDGVADARANIPSKTIAVLPAPRRELSPRALWETVELGGEQPVRLAGPSGTFDSKPRR